MLYLKLLDFGKITAESWPLEHMLERIGAKNAKYFELMDFTQGFHQVELQPLFRHLIAFITFCGVYQFTWISFEPKNAASYFQQTLAYVFLLGLLYVICEIFVDNLIVYGKLNNGRVAKKWVYWKSIFRPATL